MEKSEDFYGNEVVNPDAIVGSLGREQFEVAGSPPPIIYYQPQMKSTVNNPEVVIELPKAE